MAIPEQFIYNHLPEDTKWQLLTLPISKKDYAELPYIYSGFFKYGLQLGSNNQSVINTKNPLIMNITVPSDTYLMVKSTYGTIGLARIENQYQINAMFPGSGNYVLSIYARSGYAFGMYDMILEYKVVVD